MLRLNIFQAATTALAVIVTASATVAALDALHPAPRPLTPVERIDQAFEAAASRPLQHYSVAPKGDQLVPTPVQTLTCTKQFCEPHPKNLENLPPQQRRGLP